MITISRGDGWQRVLRLEAGQVCSLPLQGIQSGPCGEALLQVKAHGLPPRWRVAIQGLDWPGVASRHSVPGPDDWHSVTALDADHLQLVSAGPLPAYRAGAAIRYRQPLAFDGVQLSVQFSRRGGLPLATPVDICPDHAAASVRLTVAPAHTRQWPLGELQCRLLLHWPDGRQRSHTLCKIYVEN
ncbi:hypothetical protein DBR44_16315 [Aquitalea sp. FJL05]|uniref:hypothetical protein n=1 Tax=Aquitalea sp. FJL05 TaxID=2153366 RepID=UPI000F59057D|nr:hypothetical protein [Aquitalea sp. FJL05]RQO68237.1 hypothetical protein DBR44_16315 [Aquitalea sp. FJL05]